MPKVPGAWTGPKKASKRKKVNTIDPFYVGPNKKKEKHGRAIEDMSKEDTHIPKSLQNLMNWQQNQVQSEKKKEELKAVREAQKKKPVATVFLGDGDNSSSESENESDFDEDDFEDEPNTPSSSNQVQNNKNKKPNQPNQQKQQNQQNQQNQQQQVQKKRKAEESRDGEKRQKTEKGKKGNKHEDIQEEKKVQEFWELRDNVKFGETADRPPTITVKPRKAIKANVEFDAKKVAQERAREKAKLAYAASKKRKATNTGNKFFL